MKPYLMIAAVITMFLAGCNDNSKTGSDAPVADSTETSTATTLEDLSTATDIKKLLCQNWENKEDAEDAALSGGGEGLEIPYRGFSFFQDGSVTENPRDKIRFGKWALNDADKTISIEYNKGGKSSFKIVAIGAKQMILMNAADKKKVEYRADAKLQLQPAEDPFYAANNQWRIKPTKAETDSEIKQRAEACVLFYARFLADNAARGGNVISFVGLPSCFKWYRGGVSVTKLDNVEASWLNCFYSREQASKAHAMLEGIIGKKYKWNKAEKNWVKQSSEVVRQMYDTLKLKSL